MPNNEFTFTVIVNMVKRKINNKGRMYRVHPAQHVF